jgi:hypothetical protein
MRLINDKNRFIPALKKVADPLMPPVEICGIAPVKPLHGMAQITKRGADKKVIMICHKAESKNLDAEAVTKTTDVFKKPLTVTVI